MTLIRFLGCSLLGLGLIISHARGAEVLPMPDDLRYKPVIETSADQEEEPVALSRQQGMDAISIDDYFTGPENMLGLNEGYGQGQDFFFVDQVYVDHEFHKSVMLLLNVEPSQKDLVGKILSDQGSYAFHGKTKSGLGYAVYFDGYDAIEVSSYAEKLQVAIQEKADLHADSNLLPKVRDFLLPSATAAENRINGDRNGEPCLDPTPFKDLDEQAKSGKAMAGTHAMVVGRVLGSLWNCLRGLVKGFVEAIDPIDPAASVKQHKIVFNKRSYIADVVIGAKDIGVGAFKVFNTLLRFTQHPGSLFKKGLCQLRVVSAYYMELMHEMLEKTRNKSQREKDKGAVDVVKRVCDTIGNQGIKLAIDTVVPMGRAARLARAVFKLTKGAELTRQGMSEPQRILGKYGVKRDDVPAACQAWFETPEGRRKHDEEGRKVREAREEARRVKAQERDEAKQAKAQERNEAKQAKAQERDEAKRVKAQERDEAKQVKAQEREEKQAKAQARDEVKQEKAQERDEAKRVKAQERARAIAGKRELKDDISALKKTYRKRIDEERAEYSRRGIGLETWIKRQHQLDDERDEKIRLLKEGNRQEAPSGSR